METLDLIAGLAWDPEIRGFLAVLTGVVVLMGSVWLLLASNSGARLGTLIAGAGFFGWMTIMATVWWIYGIGYRGDAPRWELVEITEGTLEEGPLTFAALDEAERLHPERLPNAYELINDAVDELIATYGDSVLETDPPGVSGKELLEITELRTAFEEFGRVTPETLTPDQTAGLSDAEIEALAESLDERHRATTLSELAAVAPFLIDQNSEALAGWTLLSSAESGEAQAAAIAMVLESPDFDFGSQQEFKILDSFTIGGKKGLPDDPSRWDRIWTQIRTAAQITHPTRYGIVELQRVTPESLVNLPGKPPPTAFADPTQPVVSVIMVRNLGNLRLIPALVAGGSLLIFLAFCYMLHERDKLSMARRAAVAAGAT